MSSIDERIVEMRFNNKDFEEGVKQTQRSLNELESGLKLDGASKGLEGVSHAAKGFSLANIESSLENVSSKFSIFGAVGFTVIQDLTRAAMGFGKKILSGIINPLVEGGKKRALNIEQAKFQFKGLGMSVEQSMEDALFAVKGTAFGLDEAAVAASQFGASGIKSGQEMQNALRGIAGVAAMAGSSYTDMANVFTKVAGQGRLMGDDLNRLGTRGINAASTLADYFNKTGEGAKKTEADIRAMVTRGEIDFQTFSKAMSDAFGDHATKANETYTGSLGNLRAAFARIGADVFTTRFEALRRIFNAATPVVDAFHEALKPLIKVLNTSTLRLGDSIAKIFDGVDLTGFSRFLLPISVALGHISAAAAAVGKQLKAAFKDVFPDIDQWDFYKIAMGIRDFALAIKMGVTGSDNLQRTFRGLFSVLGIVWELVKGVVSIFGRLFGVLSDGPIGFLDITAAIGDMVYNVHQAIKGGNALGKVFEFIGSVLAIPIRLIQGLTGLFTGLIANFTGGEEAVDAFGVKAKERLEPLAAISKLLGETIDYLSEAFGNISAKMAPFFAKIGAGLKEFGSGMLEAFKNADFKGMVDILNAGLFGAVLLAIRNFVKGADDALEGAGFVQNLRNIFEGITGHLEAMQQNVKASAILKIAGALGILAAAAFVLASIDSKRLTGAMVALTVMFTQLGIALAIFTKLSADTSFVKLPLVAVSLVILSGAILLLSFAVRSLAKMSWDELGRGLVGLAGSLAILVGGVELLTYAEKDITRTAFALIPLAIAIKILASALGDIAKHSWEDLAKGGAAIAGVLAIVAAFNALSGGNEGVVTTATGMLILSVALAVMSKVMNSFGNMEWEEMVKAMYMLGGTLVLIAAGMYAMEAALPGAAATLVVAAALAVMAGPLERFSKMKWGEIGKAMTVLGGTLAILALGAYAMELALPGAAAMVVMAFAMGLMVPPLLALGSMSWGAIGKGLLALAGAFLVIGVAGTVLGFASPLIALAGAALVIFGAGMALLGGGILAFALGMTMLAGAGLVGIQVLKKMVLEMATLIPDIVTQLALGVVAFVQTLADAAPALVVSISKLITTLLQAARRNIPQIITVGWELTEKFLNTLVKAAPKLSSAGADFLIRFMRGLRPKVPLIVDEAVKLAATFIRALGKQSGKLADAGMKAVIDTLNGVAAAIDKNASKMRAAGRNIAFAIADGMTGGLLSKASSIWKSAKNLGTQAINGAKAALKSNSPSKVFIGIGEDTGKGLEIGLDDSAPAIYKSAEAIALNLTKAFEDSSTPVEDILGGPLDLQPTIKPVVDLSEVKASANLVDGMLAPAPMTLDAAFKAALDISNLRNVAAAQTPVEEQQPREIIKEVTQQFYQTNTSPESLSEIDIYRQSKNLLQLAKEELSG